ncbi:MAG: hypothetical protein ACJ762_14270 [Solirubrobacteraceae bacterium]
MINRIVLVVVASTALLSSALPAGATPNSGAGALKDCVSDGDLDRIYSPTALRRGLKAMPTDVSAYTDCDDLLRAAFAAGPSIRVVRGHTNLRVRCARSAYTAKVSVRGVRIATGRSRSCKRVTHVLRLKVNAFGRSSARKNRSAKVVLNPGGKTLRFFVRLRVRR